VLKTAEKLGGKEDFIQLAKSVALVIRNSGKDQHIHVFIEEVLNACKSSLSYDQVKVRF
jgi:hypothetical protein